MLILDTSKKTTSKQYHKVFMYVEQQQSPHQIPQSQQPDININPG